MAVCSNLAVAQFLPDAGLRDVSGGPAVPLRPSSGQTTVLIGMHSATCAGCREYLAGLAASAREFRDWDARLLAVVPGADGGDVSLPFGSAVLDPQRQVFPAGGASLLVADRYGQIFESHEAGPAHRFPPPRQIEEWLKFLGTLCPE